MLNAASMVVKVLSSLSGCIDCVWKDTSPEYLFFRSTSISVWFSEFVGLSICAANSALGNYSISPLGHVEP